MTDDIRQIMTNCKQAHDRLRRPPNAVPDTGINLRRQSVESQIADPLKAIAVPDKSPQNLPSFTPFRRTDLTFSSTLQFTAREFHITTDDIRSRERRQEISLPRQIAIWLAAKNRLNTLAGMGRYLHMDHSTMVHARNRVTSLMASDDTLRQRVLALEARILAAFHRTTVPAKHQSHLDPEQVKGHETVGQVPPVDTGS